MKKLVVPFLLTLLVLGGNAQTASAQSVGQVQNPVYTYCSVNRLQSYIDLAFFMRDHVTPEVYAKIYIPLRAKASQAKITLKNYGALSATSHDAIMALVKFVKENEAAFDQLWEIESQFAVAEDLMEMTQALSRELE